MSERSEPRLRPRPPRFYRVGRARVAVRMASVAALFHLVYLKYLSTTWGYLGYVTVPMSGWRIAAAYALAVGPALLLPRSTNRRTIIAFYVLYLLVCVPSQFCLAFSKGDARTGMATAVVLAAGSAIVAWSIRLKTWPLRLRAVRRSSYISFLVAATVVCFGLILRVGAQHLQFVSFFDASAVRRARELASGLFEPFGVGYLIAWVEYLVAPLLVLSGLLRWRVSLVALGIAAEVLIYAAATAKFALLIPPFVMGSWYLTRHGGGRHVTAYLCWGSALLFAVVVVLETVAGPGHRAAGIEAYFVQRYFGYQGFSTVLYADFAQAHGYTYWSQVKGVSALVPYPFSEPIPFMLGLFWRGTPGLSAPAHPWASDGLVAAGLPGVIVISGVIAAIFWLTDSAAGRLRADVFVPLLLVQAILLSESSLFTQLLTNGWVVMCALAAAAPLHMRSGRLGRRGRLAHPPVHAMEEGARA